MRTTLGYGLVALSISALALACHNSNEPQTPKDPIAQNINETQTPTTNPTPQQPMDPFAQNGMNHTPRDPSIETAGPQQPTFGPGGPQQPTLADPAAQKPFYFGGDSTGGKALAKTERPLSDAEIVGVIIAVNDGEVMMADQATKKATNKDVKDFVAMMKTHHSEGLRKAKSLAAKDKITPADSDVKSFLVGDVEKTTHDLRDRDGADFDKAYIDAQVSAHKAVLAAIDNRLTPSVTGIDVKGLVSDTRKVVENHIAKAEEVQKKLAAVSMEETKPEPASAKAKSTGKGLPPLP
jgi:putative membrane protein